MTFVRSMAIAASGSSAQFVERLSPPTTVANHVSIYSKDVGGISEFFVLDDAGNEVQITSGGVVNAGGAVGLTFSTTILVGSGAYQASINEFIRIDGGAAGPTVTLPLNPINNDKIGFVVVSNWTGGGGVNIDANGHSVFTVGNTNFGIPGSCHSPFIMQFDLALDCWFPAAVDYAEYLTSIGGPFAFLNTLSTGVLAATNIADESIICRTGGSDITGVGVSPNSVLGRIGSGNITSVPNASLGVIPYGSPFSSGAQTAIINVINPHSTDGSLVFTMPSSGAGNDGKRIAFLQGFTSSHSDVPVTLNAASSDKFSSGSLATESASVVLAKARGYVEYRYNWLGSSGYGVWVEIADSVTPSALTGLVYGEFSTILESGTNTAVLGKVNRYYQGGSLAWQMPTSGAYMDSKRIAFLEGRTSNPHTNDTAVTITANGSDKFSGLGIDGESSTVILAKSRAYAEYKYQWQGSNNYGVWTEVASSFDFHTVASFGTRNTHPAHAGAAIELYSKFVSTFGEAHIQTDWGAVKITQSGSPTTIPDGVLHTTAALAPVGKISYWNGSVTPFTLTMSGLALDGARIGFKEYANSVGPLTIDSSGTGKNFDTGTASYNLADALGYVEFKFSSVTDSWVRL